MREPHIDIDGWCLEDGEERHHAAPDTFWIPDRASGKIFSRATSRS
jgi:hypothetical protein